MQSVLISCILNTIDPNLHLTVSYTGNASTLWKNIMDRFLVTNGPRVQQLKAELANYKQNGLSIVTYYGNLKLYGTN